MGKQERMPGPSRDRRIAAAITTAVIALLPGHAVAGQVSTNGTSAAETRVIGASVLGRSITARRYGPADGIPVMAVGSIHGNEKSGIPLVRRIASTRVPDGFTLWVIESVNPDGNARNRRQNANGVDLNRNFDARWTALPCGAGRKYCSGARAASEPETRALSAFVAQVRPRLAVFWHSTNNVVDVPRSGIGRMATVRAYARVAGLPAYTVPCGATRKCTGNATQFVNSTVKGASAFVVELPCDSPCLGPERLAAHARAFWAAARAA